MEVDAVVLAGAPNDGRLAKVASQEWEAMIPIHGRPMVLYVLDVVARDPAVRRVILVGPAALDAYLQPYDNVRRVDPVGDIMANVQTGLEALRGTNRQVLIATGDAVLLTRAALRYFLETCAAMGKEVYYPVVSRADSEAALPGVERTYARLAEGEFTGGNLFLLTPSVIDRAGQLLVQAMQWRKEPWRLATLFGLPFIARFLLRRLSIAEVEEAVREKLGIDGAGVIVPFAEIGFDVDKPSDLELATRQLAAMRVGGASMGVGRA